eukprot:CAMPEP_0178450566 /NCGR_PEP_ID=MMETSP0689_2-20121128/43193_1 /TAXON_ID=160604 /ORGANISM="Amphidinium massartii, Strain CS-259" /LENGTH=71 /DNA_ID=CAMNT_0020076041 /DNA_START=185 /DNA_END=400 /DNA_ORIENTATION=-
MKWSEMFSSWPDAVVLANRKCGGGPPSWAAVSAPPSMPKASKTASRGSEEAKKASLSSHATYSQVGSSSSN